MGMAIDWIADDDIGSRQVALLPRKSGMVSIDIKGQEAQVDWGIELNVVERERSPPRAYAKPEREIVAAVGSSWQQGAKGLLNGDREGAINLIW